MIYVSQLLLNPRSRQVQSELANPYQMHRTFSKAFGDGEGEFARARPLFCVVGRGNGDLKALVQSRLAPNWERLTADPSYLTAPPQTKRIGKLALRPGQRLRFSLRANPTKRLPSGKSEASSDGKRIGVYGEDAQREWLDRKAEASGFRVLDCRAVDRGFQVSRRRNGSPPLRHLCVEFEGLLEVTDPDRLLAALESGIGSAKAFGFGLLAVAPI